MSDLGSITRLRELPHFRAAVDKLLIGNNLEIQDRMLILSAAQVLIRDFEKDRQKKQSYDFAFWLVLNYSLEAKDYRPLYDFAFSFGLYPICDVISGLTDFSSSLLGGLGHIAIEEAFSHNKIIETAEQTNRRKSFLSLNHRDFAYNAPTSFGKTQLVIEGILEGRFGKKSCVIVPTKSLLSQTYRNFRKKKNANKNSLT